MEQRIDNCTTQRIEAVSFTVHYPALPSRIDKRIQEKKILRKY